jgi:hypothetical protein
MRSADLEVGDTAGLEACATVFGSPEAKVVRPFAGRCGYVRLCADFAKHEGGIYRFVSRDVGRGHGTKMGWIGREYGVFWGKTVRKRDNWKALARIGKDWQG